MYQDQQLQSLETYRIDGEGLPDEEDDVDGGTETTASDDATGGKESEFAPVTARTPPVRSVMPGVDVLPPKRVKASSRQLTKYFPKFGRKAVRGCPLLGRAISKAPIWPKFVETFKRCAPGCTPGVNNVWGCRGGRSLHPHGRAIDIDFIECGGKKHWARRRDRRGRRARASISSGNDKVFDRFVKCFREVSNSRGCRRGNKWHVMYNEPSRVRKTVWGRVNNRRVRRSFHCSDSGKKIFGVEIRTYCHYDHVHLDLGCKK